VSASLYDVSAWVAAVFPSHPAHARAQAALEQATPEEPAAFCRATQISFVRLITTSALLQQYAAPHMTNQSALEVLERLCARPEITEADEPSGIFALWRRMAGVDSPSPKVWMDAYLAAFAIVGGWGLVTLDKDFKNYEPHGLNLHLL